MENSVNKKIKMNTKWFQVIKDQVKVFLVEKKTVKKQNTSTMSKDDYAIDLIQRAKMDLEQSKNFFANVTDPDLVDYAAHKILANQSFYAYLLKKARTENITFHR